MRSIHVLLAAALTTLSLGAAACSGETGEDDSSSTESDLSSSKKVRLTKADDGKTVKVTPGATVVLSLPHDASTGYGWMIRGGDLGAPEQDFVSGDPTLPGSSGKVTFTWSTAGATGTHTLELVLQRPWAERVPPIDTFTVTLDFDAAPERCGGFRGAECSDPKTYCSYGLACGAADRPGVCLPRPRFCPMYVSPVCGCDGETYSNACVAASRGVSVASSGACAEK